MEKTHCLPCGPDSKPLTSNQIHDSLTTLTGWQLEEDSGIPILSKNYSIKEYSTLIQLANVIADLAEQENHHPRMVIEWGQLKISWWTHVIKGLHSNDFVMAKLCDECYKKVNN